jgi:hypothetical protein
MNAGVAELADAQDSGSCGRKVVEVQVLSPALKELMVKRQTQTGLAFLWLSFLSDSTY